VADGKENITGKSVELSINGKKVGLNLYVKSVFFNIVMGLIGTLKDVEEPEEIVVKIKR
jgi:hypothetical protein